MNQEPRGPLADGGDRGTDSGEHRSSASTR